MPVILEGTPYAYKYADASVPEYPAGTLLMEENGGYSGTVWVVDYLGKLRWFKTGEQFEKLGFKWDQIVKVPDSVLKAYNVDNAVQITDTNPPILVAPKSIANGNMKKYLIAGAVVVLAVIVFLKIRGKGKGK